MANPVGAPVKYTDEVPKKLVEFFSRDLFIEVDGKRMPNRLPTIEKFCCEIDIVKSTFYEWVKKYPALSNAFNKAKAHQKDQLMQLALLGFYKEGFAKFVAINITDMKDKVEHSIDKASITVNIDKDDEKL